MLDQAERPVQVVWRPLAGSQALAVSCPAHRILYEGTRGPGKTDAQLMFFRRYVGAGYGAFWRGIIFDREYKNLDDLIAKSLRWFPKFGDNAKFLSSRGDYRWVWPSGECLYFRTMRREEDYWKFHGQEFPFIGWNELTKYPTSKAYDLMMSCNRSSFLPSEHSPDLTRPLPDIPLVAFSTTNPFGPGHTWVKRRFVDVAPPGKIIRTTTRVFNPRTQEEEDVVSTQVRIFGTYKENKYLSPLYVAELERTADPMRKRAWLTGDWNIVAGGALDDCWKQSVHVVPRFRVPKSWNLDRSFDWGSTRPFSVGFWAEANGEEVEVAPGVTWCPQKGSMIRFNEFYGSQEIGTDTGLKMSAKEVARKILSKEAEMLAQGWISGRVMPGPADSAIYASQEVDTKTIASLMEDEGVAWTPADKAPGTRKNGLELLRTALKNSLDGEGVGIYFMDNCAASLALLPVVPRDPDDQDDVDTDAEDHLYDDVRYRVLDGAARYPLTLKTVYPT